jgi:Dolichyl-phosphate-mannose-protein mannosyltransferase
LAKRKRPQAAATPAVSIAPQITAIVLFILLAVFALIRLRLLDLPLERDEGEYAYAGQLLLQGIAPYKLVYNMKWPGTYAAYALLMGIFGESISGIRIGLILVTSATALCLYFLTARLFGRAAGVAAAATELLLSVTIAAMGPYAHATHFVALCAVGGFLLLSRPRTVWHYAAAGALLALAAVMKQPGMFFGILAALLVVDPTRENAKPVRDTAALAGGAVLVAAITAGLLAMVGVFGRFKFWTIDYARQYVSETTLADGLKLAGDSLGSIWHYTQLLWLIAAAGAVLLFVDLESRRHWKLVAALTIAGLLTTTPGLYFRQHYFITLFPAIAVLNGVAVGAGSRLLARRGFLAPAGFALAFLITLGQQWTSLTLDARSIDHALYGDSPFFEAIEVANYIKDHTAASDTIAVLGSEPEIYFYANRKSATGYIYTYPLMEKQKFAHHMQEEMIAEIERAKPKYLVTVSVAFSWLARPDSDKTIFDWSEKIANSGAYVLDGIADETPGGTTYVWGADAQRYQPRTQNVVMIFKRVR